MPWNTYLQLTNKLTALELDAKKAGAVAGAGVGEEGKGEAAGSAGKAYLSLEEYKEATAAGALHAENVVCCVLAGCRM